MAKKVTANGKTFTFDDDVTTEQISTAVDEYFSSKKKVETAPSASTSMVTPTTAPLEPEGGTSGLGITPSASQGIPSLPGRVNPQTLSSYQMPSNQEDEIAMQKRIEKEMGGLSIPSDEQLSKVNIPGTKQVRVSNNALGEKKYLDVSQGETKQVDGMFIPSMTFDDKALIQDQANITAEIEAKDLKGKSDYFNKVYAPIAKQKGLDLASDGATMDFYLNYLKDTNPAEYKYNLDKFMSLRDAVEEGKNTKNYAGNTKDDQLDLERFEAELITKGTRLKTEAYSGFKRETKATIENYYQDKVDNFSKLSSDGDKKISEVNSVIAELDKFPKNENGEIITDATNRKQVEQLIEKQQKLVGELETIQGGIGELKNDKDFNDAYSLMQDADARQEEVSKRYYDLATNNPEAFKNLPEYKALIESKAAAKKKKDYMESMNITSFGVGEGIGQAVTNFVSKIAYIPKSLGSDEYGITDRIYDSASQNIQDFNDEYITTPTEMDKPLLEDGKWSLKYLPGKLAGTATDMALMILTTKGIGGATGALPLVSESVASAVGQVASGYTMSAQGYYEEAKQSGMSEADANSIAREVAILDGFLELVSPNEKLLSPFKLKDDFASYAKALANGATKKKALAETTRKIIEKNIPENFQELLQTTNAHVMFTSNELSKANESARQSFGEEVVETVIMTTLLTTLMGGKESVTTRNRYNNEALYMAAFAPDKMMATMSKNLERGLITQEQHDALTKKITIASEALKKMGDVPQEKKIKTLPAMVEKMEEEAKKKETDTQFQAPIDEKIKTKEEEINQVLNEPSEAEMLDENIAYLQELEAEGVIDDNQKELLDYLLTKKQTQNEQSQEGQVQAQEVITPVEETAPYVVDKTEQRQPIELSVETPKVETSSGVEGDVARNVNMSIEELEKEGFDISEYTNADKELKDYYKTIDGTNAYKTKKQIELEGKLDVAADNVRKKGNEWANKKQSKPTPKVEAPTKKEEAKPEVKAVELEARFPGGMPRKMEFKDGEWKQNVGGDYTTVAPAVQQQAQEAFDGIKTEVKKEEVTPVEKPAVAEVAAPEVKAEVVPEVKAEKVKLRIPITTTKGDVNEYSLKSVLTDAPVVINPTKENISAGISFLEAINEEIKDADLANTITLLKDQAEMLELMRSGREEEVEKFIKSREKIYEEISNKNNSNDVSDNIIGKQKLIERLDDFSKQFKLLGLTSDAESVLKKNYNDTVKEIKKRFVVEKQKPNRLKEISETKPVEVKKEAVVEPTKKEEVSGSEFSVPVNEIETDTKRFQNRKRKFSEKSVKKIVEGFDENKLDAITLWKDPADGKTYVISGHSRLEAHKQLGKPNVKSKYFVGTEQEAKEFGRTSNVSGEQETLTERANYYRGLRKDGKKNSEIGKEAKKNEGANAIKVLSISHLNPDGALIQDIDKMEGADVRSENKLIDAANWMGDARMRNPQLTDAHEQEMYDWLIKDGAIDKIKSKVEFGQRISNIVGGMFFDAKNPLNLKNKSTKGALENEVDDEINGVKSEIKELEKERDSRTKPATSKRLDEITAQVKLLNAKLGKLNEALKAAKEGDKQQVSIFDQIEEVINEKEVTDEAANEYINSTEKIDESEAVIEAIESEEKNKEGATEKELEQVISDIDKEIGEVKEKPIESNKKEDIIDKEAEAAMEADKSVKEDEKLVFEIENVNIAKLKAEKDEKMIEQRAVTAMAKAYKAWKDKKITYSTYTALKNKIEDVVEGKVKKSKLEGRVQEEVAVQKLADIKKKVKDKLLGEGYNPSQLYSAPGINPKVINDLIDGAFNLAEKAIRAGFTIKEAVEKASKLIKSSPAYKAAVRNKQIDEKEFESKISEAVNEETEALKKAFEEEQKKKVEKTEAQAKEISTEEKEALQTGEKGERTESKRQKQSKKYQDVYDNINKEFAEYEKVSKENAIRFVNKKLAELEGKTDALFDLANQIIEGRSPFSILVNPTATMALGEKMNKLSKDNSLPLPSKMAAKKLAGELFFAAAKQKTEIAQAMSLLDITAQLISTDESVTMANIQAHMQEVYKKRTSKKEQDEVDEVSDEINEYISNEYSPEELSKIKEEIREEILAEYAERIFGKETAEKLSAAIDSMFIDLKGC